MQLGLPEQIVAVLADAVEPREDALVVDTLALDVEEGALGQRVTQVAHVTRVVAEHHGRARGAHQAAEERHARQRTRPRARH